MVNEQLTLSNTDTSVINARNAEQALFKYYGLQATDHYLELSEPKIKIRVSEIGEGRPVLIVPGNTGDVFPLAPLLAQLKGYRIIAFNRPGGGLSEGLDHTQVDIRPFAVQTIIAVLDAFKLDSVDIVAHSMGAHWSLWAAMDQPQRVRSLSLLGNPGNVMKGKLPLIVRMLVKPPFNRLLFKFLTPADINKALNPLKTMGHSAEILNSQPKELGAAYFYFRKLPHYFLSATSLLQNAAPKIDEQQLQQVPQPAQLLLGDKDTFASVKIGESITSAMPHGELHVIKGAGHLPWMESAEECGRIIREFIGGR